MRASLFIHFRDLLIDDKKSGVDRSTTVIAKEPEGNLICASLYACGSL